MPRATRLGRIAAAALIVSASVLASVGDADARRAGGFGGFGSRGTRTFDAPAVTRTAPAPASPIERSMTPRPQTSNPGGMQQPGFAQPRRGLFGGFAGSMIGGLVAGGLLGMLIGHGFGGGFGFLGMILQIVLVMVLVSMALRFFRNRNPAYGRAGEPGNFRAANSPAGFPIPPIGGTSGLGGGSGAGATVVRKANDEIGLTQNDLSRFESLLTDIQAAYGKEDFATLRRLTTPEAMSYLAEEIGENASRGLRNQVSDVKLLQGDIAESWRENAQDYATLAMRYSSIDAMVDRDSGKLISGDTMRASESTEIWTFVRRPGEDWKLSAIQGTDRQAA